MNSDGFYDSAFWLSAALLSVAILPMSTTLASQPEPGDSSVEAVLRDYYSANGLLSRGLYELAEAEYERFLSEHGNHERAPVARYGLAVCLFRMKRCDEAVVELSRLRQVPEFPYAAEVATMLGRCRLSMQQYEQAAEAFGAAVEQCAEHDLADDAAIGLIEALYLDRRFDEAVSRCRDLVSRHPDSPVREREEFFGGLAEMGRNEYAAAARRFGDLLERYPTGPFADRATLLLGQCHHHGNAVGHAIDAYRLVLRQASGRYVPDALLGLATLLQRQGDHEEAGSLLDQLLEEFPDSSLATMARLQRGQVWFEQGRFDRAFEAFAHVAKEAGGLQDDALYWMAKCKLREGEFADAAMRLARVIEEFPQSELLAEMCYDHGITLARAGQSQAAIRALKEFRSRFSNHPLVADALHLLAATEHQELHYDESRTYCDAFLSQYAAHESASAVLFLSAENQYLSGRYADAVDGFRRFLSQYPGDQQARKATYRLGMGLYRLQQFDEAEPLLAGIVDAAGEDPVFRSASFALGDLHFQRGEWKQAEQSLSRYVSSGLEAPSADDALIKLGLARQWQEEHEAALRAYDRLIEHFKDSPHRVQAMFERGQVLVALQRPDAAAEAFERVLNEGGAERFAPFALNHLGLIALEQERYVAAAEYFARFLQQYPSHERSGYACAQLAVALARQDRHAEALETIERLEREYAGQVDPSLHLAVQYEKAWCLRQSNQAEAAASAYRRLLDSGPAEALRVRALLELAGMEEQARRYEAAAELLGQLRERMLASPDLVPPEVQEHGTYRLGICEFELEHDPQAAEVFEEFITKFPKSPLAASAGFFCGESLFRMGRHERAVNHLTRVTQEFTADPVYGPSLLRLGECLARLQRWMPSEKAFAEYLDRFGDSPQWFQARFGIGWACEHQQRYDEAISAYRLVASRHEGSTAARAQFQIGECLFAKGQCEEAAPEFLKVDILYAYPEWSAGALYEAGRCFEKLGKPVEARAQFKAVIEKHKESRWSELAEERLVQVSNGSLPGRAVRQTD